MGRVELTFTHTYKPVLHNGKQGPIPESDTYTSRGPAWCLGGDLLLLAD